MGIKDYVIKTAADLVMDMAGDKLATLSPGDVVTMLQRIGTGGTQKSGTMYDGTMYDDTGSILLPRSTVHNGTTYDNEDNIFVPRSTMYGGSMYDSTGNIFVPRGLKEIYNGTKSASTKPTSTKPTSTKSAGTNTTGTTGTNTTAAPASDGSSVVPNTDAVDNATSADGGKDKAEEKVKFNPKDYQPSAGSTAAYKFAVPIIGDTLGAVGNAYNIGQGMLAQMLAIMADTMNKQTQYSNLNPGFDVAATNMQAALQAAKGQVGKLAGDTFNNRLQDIAATSWSQAMSNANRKFYVDYEPNNGQQELDARLLTTAKNKVERSLDATNSNRAANTRLRRPGGTK